MEEPGCFGACQAGVLKESEVAQETVEKEGTYEDKTQDSVSPGPILLTVTDGAILFLPLLLPLAPPISPEEGAL